MAELEFPLSGGNSTTVVRIGNTVRRPLTRCSPTIHALLIHLEQVGFQGSPRFLGVDTQNREILSFLSGDVGFADYLWADQAVIAAAQLLRAYHDATVSFVPPAGTQWQRTTEDVSHHEVICHHDFAPYNLVCQGQKPIALIDFDLVGPGSRLHDVAFGVYWFAPLSFSSDLTTLSTNDLRSGAYRLHLFCHSYGIEPTLALVGMVEQVLGGLVNWLQDGGVRNDANAKRMIAEGHLLHWQQELAAFQHQRPTIEQLITG